MWYSSRGGLEVEQWTDNRTLSIFSFKINLKKYPKRSLQFLCYEVQETGDIYNLVDRKFVWLISRRPAKWCNFTRVVLGWVHVEDASQSQSSK